MKTKTILDRIVEYKLKELEKEKKKRNFKKALKVKKLSLIAEIKRASPSKGVIRKNFNIVKIAKEYNTKDVSAISVITDEKFFKGKLDYLKKVKKITNKPVLRKDFIIDEYQIYESGYYGADAILLIAAILSKEQINNFIRIAKKIGMDCLVEVHNLDELKKSLKTKAEIIGINNRDLKTFKVDLNTTLNLLDKIPKEKIIVSESGFNSKEDIEIVKGKVDAVLVGTSIIKSKNIKEKINEFMKPKIKICGITNLKDALASSKADILGFNFYKKSPRCIAKENAREIIKKLPKSLVIVGVFVNESIKNVFNISEYCNLDIIQLHGDESNNYVKKLKSKLKNIKIIKAVRIKTLKDVKQIEKFPNVDYVLFDTKVKGFYGGTGKTFNWNILKNMGKPSFLSGGLNVENIRKAVENVNPYGVDVCSGVELKPGKKNVRKLKELINLIKK